MPYLVRDGRKLRVGCAVRGTKKVHAAIVLENFYGALCMRCAALRSRGVVPGKVNATMSQQLFMKVPHPYHPTLVLGDVRYRHSLCCYTSAMQCPVLT
eukprot:1194608-Rhodomonas_salina.2